MDKIREIVDALGEQDVLWKEHFEDVYLPFAYLNDEASRSDIEKNRQRLLAEILNKQKQLVDTYNEDEEAKLWENIADIIDSSAVMDIIKDLNNDIMDIYRNTRPLRETQESIIPLIINVFENISVNYTPEFLEMREEYGIESAHDFITVVLQLDRIISVHVSRHYNKQIAQKEFVKVTGLENKYGLVYAELYEKYLERLQHNICIDKLEELSMRIDRLTQEVRDITKKLQKA